MVYWTVWCYARVMRIACKGFHGIKRLVLCKVKWRRWTRTNNPSINYREIYTSALNQLCCMLICLIAVPCECYLKAIDLHQFWLQKLYGLSINMLITSMVKFCIFDYTNRLYYIVSLLSSCSEFWCSLALKNIRLQACILKHEQCFTEFIYFDYLDRPWFKQNGLCSKFAYRGFQVQPLALQSKTVFGIRDWKWPIPDWIRRIASKICARKTIGLTKHKAALLSSPSLKLTWMELWGQNLFVQETWRIYS